MVILGIAGKAESGKTTFANLLKDQLENLNQRVILINYADYVKFIAEKYYNWNGEKDEYGRQLLQTIGTEKGRNLVDKNLWVDMVINTVQLAQLDFDVAIVADCRFPNEFDRWEERGDRIVKIKIERPNYENHLTDMQRNHLSEVALDNYANWDITITNPGTIEEFTEVTQVLAQKIVTDLEKTKQ